jgi:hypothetical protein
MPNLCAVRRGFGGGCRIKHDRSRRPCAPDYESAKGRVRLLPKRVKDHLVKSLCHQSTLLNTTPLIE